MGQVLHKCAKTTHAIRKEIINILGDEMDSTSMASMRNNTGIAYWSTFMVGKNCKHGVYMIALTDKKKRKVYDRRYILVEK